jgi:Lar family restriction alleviation protein
MANNTDIEFKPCPFCGGTDIRCDKHHNTSYERSEKFVWSMCCYSCGATFPNRYRRELLLEAWNRRTDP